MQKEISKGLYSKNTQIHYHQIEGPDGGLICVTLCQVSDTEALDITMDPLCDLQGEHVQSLSVPSDAPVLAAPFEPLPPENRVCSMIERLLRADGQASQDLSRGLKVVARVRSTEPKPGTLVTESSSLSVYRSIRLIGPDLIRPILLKQPIMSSLRRFQVDGVDWLCKTPKAILADDMGLGKTVQAIYALRLLFNEGKAYNALVICPKSLLSNWENELSKWAPELGRVRLVPKASIREQVWKTVLNANHVLLTNYEQVRNPPRALQEQGVDVIIADEAHRIRNIGSQVAKGIRKIRTNRLWALTGTPVERDPEDLATILSILEPNRFSVLDKRLHIASLRSQARPYVLRRLKSDVLTELPDVWEDQQLLDLLPGQRKSYDNLLRRTANSGETDILAIINEMRTICDYDNATGESVKIDRIIEIVDDVIAAGDKAVVFSYLLEPLDVLQSRLEKLLQNNTVLNLRGSMSIDEREQAINLFKSRDDVHVILCSLRVAGEGLTLTEANHVIFLNEWWNPSANVQARDRVVRIGQRKGVRVYKFRCRNTIEETLEEILLRKTRDTAQLVDRLADTGTTVNQMAPLNSDLMLPDRG